MNFLNNFKPETKKNQYNKTIMKFQNVNKHYTLILVWLITYNLQASNSLINSDTTINIINKTVLSFVNGENFKKQTGYNKKQITQIESIQIDNKKKQIHIYFDYTISQAPIRPLLIKTLNTHIKESLSKSFHNYNIYYHSDGYDIHKLIPNYYSASKKEIDKSRQNNLKTKSQPLVENISKPWLNNSTLSNRNIALWHSHGWCYEASLHRWEWQRARLFRTVEDLFPMTYTINFLVPMLENSGCNILMPRERDWQLNEIVVDNNQSHNNSKLNIFVNTTEIPEGFAIGTPPYTNENPFRLGTALSFKSEKKGKVAIKYLPNIPETGFYPVYISYKTTSNSADDVSYKVYHSGGITQFKINQTIGGGTWIYLGKFKFRKGQDSDFCKIEILNSSKKANKTITADAIRLGSGMGIISRNNLTSMRPKYQEAARYYLQYAGFPDSLVWNLNNDNNTDYTDDRISRGEWVNYLSKKVKINSNNKNIGGLGIPIDLTFAFHTDAGITSNDTVVGTLGIYSSKKGENNYPNGLSKLSSRDLTDIIQSQIVNDLRIKYDKDWTRRDMWNKAYSEASRPSTPTMLLELLSHQNLLDIRFGHEPQFQFDVSRAIYKGMLKFMATLHKFDFVVQPLPVTHFKTQITSKQNIQLSWIPQSDKLEQTANPTSFIVYTRIGNGSYDNGVQVKNNEFIIDKPIKDSIYSFKISAYNKGGESFPSEELSVCINSSNPKKILIINAFDRLGTPAYFDDKNYGGLLNQVDEGVPYMTDFYTVGNQYDFNKNSLWIDDDSPGFGASSAELENTLIAGNTFNFSYIHGKAIQNAGYSFASVSDEAFEDNNENLDDYLIIDLLAGEEKTSYFPKNDSTKQYQLFTKKMIHNLNRYLTSGGNLLISGAHIASDFHMNKQDTIIGEILKYKWRTSNASSLGKFYFIDADFAVPSQTFEFNTHYSTDTYRVEGADALEPFDTNSTTLIRYSENNMSAAIAHKKNYGVVALGFPFETILGESDKNYIMKKIINYLTK